jgi:RNA polymerase sigma-70 factor (ECF subfamily)
MVTSVIGYDDDWEDICQQIFVKMVLSLRRLRQIETFESWLFRIARNSSLDYLRRRRARQFLLPWRSWCDSIAGEAPGALHSKLSPAIARLPPDERELITMICDEGHSYSRLARLTGKSVSSIKSRLFRARRRLRQFLTEV